MTRRTATGAVGATSKARRKRGRPPAGDSELTRQTILRSAEQVFGELGYRGASMDKIAELAGVAPSVLYHYAPSKAQLYAQVIIEAATALDARYQEALDAHPGVLERFNAVLDVLTEIYAAERARMFFLASRHHEVVRNPELLDVIGREKRLTENLIDRIVREGKASGEIPAEVPPKYVKTMLRVLFDALAHVAAACEPVAAYRAEVAAARDLFKMAWQSITGARPVLDA